MNHHFYYLVNVNSFIRLGVLRGYQGEDIEIQLPGNMTMRDIDWLSVWCISFRENFGHVMIPKDLDLPPALGQNQLTVRRSFDLIKLYQIRFTTPRHTHTHTPPHS